MFCYTAIVVNSFVTKSAFLLSLGISETFILGLTIRHKGGGFERNRLDKNGLYLFRFSENAGEVLHLR